MQNSIVDLPPSRRLRVYAFDPSLAQRLQTAPIQEIVIPVRWELDRRIGKLPLGPIGEYIEVVDIDPASGVVYPPVNLDDPTLLAQDGLPLSEGNPQFHQQMVYAVAMATIEHFEHALGRVCLWTARQVGPAGSGYLEWQQFVRRLRLYPHALRDRNAYYSPDKKAILFGYFPVQSKDAFNTPGTTVFTCLSHDIIAHEVTHALLDGVHPRFNEPSNPDVHAFHEAFADLVALLQHFSYQSVLRDQIARTRGRLDDSENLLAQLAQQFGQATGCGSALRDAIGEFSDGQWRRKPADPTVLEHEMEPHARGAILVAAVFGAFLLVYRRQTEDLYRIATNGSGLLPEGDIYPDLAARLAQEASECALYLLRMCIRALDFCPPVNITFGDYLRAVITAEANLNPEDELGYSVALIESFRQWGIYPRGIRSMSKEALIWPSGAEVIAESESTDAKGRGIRRVTSKKQMRKAREESERAIKALFEQNHKLGKDSTVQSMKWDLESDRFDVWQNMQQNRRAVWGWLVLGEGRRLAKAFGIVLGKTALKTVYQSKIGEPTTDIHSVRTALRRDTRGTIVTDLVVEITQRRRGYFTEEEQRKVDAEGPRCWHGRGDFRYRSGCTIVIDTIHNSFRHIIRTPGMIDNDVELGLVRSFLTGDAGPSTDAFDGLRAASQREPSYRTMKEPFAILHRHINPV